MAGRFGLVFGGCGALGKAVVNQLSKEGFKAISIDLLNNADAYNNILVRPSWSLHEQSTVIRDGLDDILGKNKVSNVFCAAGGWKGGSIRDSDFLQAFADNSTVNLEPALLASYFGVRYLEKDGLLVLTGAAAARDPQPDMIAYGMSKATTHYLVQSIARDKELAAGKRNITAIAVLPEVIDTVANRFAMPNADTSTWSKPEDIATQYSQWVNDPESRPSSGSLMLVQRANDAASWSSV